MRADFKKQCRQDPYITFTADGGNVKEMMFLKALIEGRLEIAEFKDVIPGRGIKCVQGVTVRYRYKEKQPC